MRAAWRRDPERQRQEDRNPLNVTAKHGVVSPMTDGTIHIHAEGLGGEHICMPFTADAAERFANAMLKAVETAREQP